MSGTAIKDLQSLKDALALFNKSPVEHAKDFFREKYGVDFEKRVVVISGRLAREAGVPELLDAKPSGGLLASPAVDDGLFLLMNREFQPFVDTGYDATDSFYEGSPLSFIKPS